MRGAPRARNEAQRGHSHLHFTPLSFAPFIETHMSVAELKDALRDTLQRRGVPVTKLVQRQ